MILTKYAFSTSLRRFSTSIKPKVLPNAEVLQNIEQGLYKPKTHPGIIPIKTVRVPDKIVQAMQNVLADYPSKSIVTDATKLNNYIHARLLPVEADEVKEIRNAVYAKAIEKARDKHKDDFETTASDPIFQQRIKDQVIHNLKKKVYNWHAVAYDAYNALVYMVARFAMEYSVLYKIFGEIRQRDEHFQPRSFFDYGAGTGTAMWACKAHFPGIYEYFNVDTSSFMNDLSLLLLQDGRGNKIPAKGVFYRQFLPSGNNLYDIVVSAYSLMELPSRRNRLETVLNLWNKTGSYLIFVEEGTNAGFQIITEVRDFLLEIGKDQNQGYVFSPCPHDITCPRFASDSTPCNFLTSYMSLPIVGKSQTQRALYSYIVFKKGKRTSNESEWPRVVRETLVRPRHTICRMCTKHGTLNEVIFSAAKHGKTSYHCARATKWGDRLPIDLLKTDIEKPGEDNPNETRTNE